MDLRRRAMDRLAAGQTSYEVAAALKVAVSSVIKWAARQRATGSVAPGKMGGHRRPKIAGADRDWVLAQIDRNPHMTIAALTDGLAARKVKRIHPAWAAVRLIFAVAPLEQRGIVFVHFDEFNQTLDSEVGERRNAVFADPIDPDHAVFGFHLHGDVEEPVLVFAKVLGDEVDGFDVRDLVDVHDQAA